MARTVAATVVAFVLWSLFPGVRGIEVLVYATIIALPVAAIHGIFRYGAFDIAPGDRGRNVVRSSNLLITVVYAAGVATPAVLFADRLGVVPAVLITTLVAVGLLPVRTWLQRWIHRALFGDRERQLAMLSELGAQLEQATDQRQLLARLAEAVREGLDATWVQIRLGATEGAFAASPVGDLAERWPGHRSSGAISSTATRRSGASRSVPGTAAHTPTPSGCCCAPSPDRPRHPSPTCS